MSTITRAIEDLLKEHTSGYDINRNPRRNSDPNAASRGKGWIGIYKGPWDMAKHTTTRFKNEVNPQIEIQVCNLESGDKAEDDLEASVNEILTLLSGPHGRNLSGTIGQTTGYKVEYDINRATDAYFYSATITIKGEVLA